MEKLAWAVTLAASVFYASYQVRVSLEESEQNPISTSIETAPVQGLPFPAVSIRAGKARNNYRYVQDDKNFLLYRHFFCSGK